MNALNKYKSLFAPDIFKCPSKPVTLLTFATNRYRYFDKCHPKFGYILRIYDFLLTVYAYAYMMHQQCTLVSYKLIL